MRHDCFPASALQTPIYLLLLFAPFETIDFIIEFSNRAILSFYQSPYGHDLEEVYIDIEGIKIKQYISPSIWQMYRGSGPMTTPHLLKSIHMAFEAIANSGMWHNQFNEAQAVLFAFIKLKPIYDSSYNAVQQNMQFGRHTSIETILTKFDEEVGRLIGDVDFYNMGFNIGDLDVLSIYDIDTVMQLIPAETSDKAHKEIITHLLPTILPQILCDRRENRETNDNIDYDLHGRFFRKSARFLLSRELKEIDDFAKLFIMHFDATEETSAFLDEIISVEDELKRYDQFWKIWGNIEPKYLEMSQNAQGFFYFSKVTHSYLLAWQWWRSGIEEWHSLKEPETRFYEIISEKAGRNPSVLYSISKVLNNIGSHFIHDGISWINTIITNNKNLETAELEPNTVYYIENIMRKYAAINTEKIRRDARLKSKIVNILNFLIVKGSVKGYLLREEII